ncbi:MAG: sugar phosphate isomerase/epimerase [Erythrobacter sp.]|nr:sugar phosphate isomerase/epimerase [Erythrobacter sp.]
MPIGINLLLWTGHVTRELRPVLEEIAATGFDGVEVPVFDATDPGHYRDLASLLDDLGLRRTVSTAFSDPRLNPVSPVPGERQAAFDQARQVADCAAALGGELVVGPLFQPLGHFTGTGPSEAELDCCAAFLSAYAGEMRDRQLTCAVEPLNRFEAHVLNTGAQAVAMMERVADPAVGVLFDTFHAHIEEKDPLAALGQLLDAGVLAHVHVSENDRGTPGSGQARIAEAIGLVRARDYRGWLTIEAFGQAVPELAAATRVWRPFFVDPAEVVSQGYRYIRECIAG